MTPSNTQLDEHELRLLPNGDFLVISAPTLTGIDLTSMKITTADGGIETLSGPQQMATCNLVEFTASGTVVWSWDILDHFDPVADSVYPIVDPFQPQGQPTIYDPFHCNSIDVDPNNGNLLVSAREMASVFYIDKASGTVLWKMGAPPPARTERRTSASSTRSRSSTTRASSPTGPPRAAAAPGTSRCSTTRSRAERRTRAASSTT